MSFCRLFGLMHTFFCQHSLSTEKSRYVSQQQQHVLVFFVAPCLPKKFDTSSSSSPSFQVSKLGTHPPLCSFTPKLLLWGTMERMQLGSKMTCKHAVVRPKEIHFYFQT